MVWFEGGLEELPLIPTTAMEVFYYYLPCTDQKSKGEAKSFALGQISEQQARIQSRASSSAFTEEYA